MTVSTRMKLPFAVATIAGLGVAVAAISGAWPESTTYAVVLPLAILISGMATPYAFRRPIRGSLIELDWSQFDDETQTRRRASLRAMSARLSMVMAMSIASALVMPDPRRRYKSLVRVDPNGWVSTVRVEYRVRERRPTSTMTLNVRITDEGPSLSETVGPDSVNIEVPSDYPFDRVLLAVKEAWDTVESEHRD
jgi:hypothetical protein